MFSLVCNFDRMHAHYQAPNDNGDDIKPFKKTHEIQLGVRGVPEKVNDILAWVGE
jgi:hypothetical protein